MFNGCEVKHIQYTNHRATYEPHSHTGTLLPIWKIIATAKAEKGSPAPRATAVLHGLQTHFFYPNTSLSALRTPLEQGCKQGTYPGRLCFSWMLYPTIWNHTWIGAMALRGSHVIAIPVSFFTGWCLSRHPSQNQSSVKRCLHMQISPHPAQAHLSCREIRSNQPMVVSTREPRTLSQRISNSGIKSLPHPRAAPPVCSICRTHHPPQQEFSKIEQLA